MEFGRYLNEISTQTDAMRAAALAAGADAAVPTCPEWTVLDLVRHLAAVHGWAALAARTGEHGARPPMPEAPDGGLDEVLDWWTGRTAELLDTLRAGGPEAPAWTFAAPHRAGFWARRQAHETAVHRLDAELAAGREVPSLVFDPEFAADGTDEMLSQLLRGLYRPHRGDRAGTVLVHAADAGRAWLVTIEPGVPFRTSERPVLDADLSIVGTADAVYRAVWGRPSTAVTTGDETLYELLRS